MAVSTLMKRIEAKQLRRGENGCWPWLGFINVEGEARVWVDDELGSVTVPHAILLLEHRNRGEEIPPDKEALSCPILKECSNPKHVSLASRSEIADRILARKGLKRRPLRNKRVGLSDEEVRQIFLSRDATSALAKRFNVTEGQISNIRAGRRRRTITVPLGTAEAGPAADRFTPILS